ncbi:MAG: hypothetical protein A4E36_00100 [Methanoregulaceae archaeon PtaB.Bin009]|nr:MAG: hypothetical protein A4E36_00100 [Methanoregulaceae archaeon PtaB.Bin009]OPY42364.1 MAG: hypothetical protein A4E41_00356 [Methanoregulaceae archaeon PtaU1.Bin066]
MIKLLAELRYEENPNTGTDEGVLDLQVHQVPPGKNREVRDEIQELMAESCGRGVIFRGIEADTIIAEVRGATEETVQHFENHGWVWEAPGGEPDGSG